MNGKKGLVALVVVLVAVVALASVAYGALAPKAKNTTLEEAATLVKEGSDATESASDGGASAESGASGAAQDDSSIKYPEFTVFDTEGNKVGLKDVLENGKPVFLGFWTTWCPNCVEEAPAIQKLYERYGDQVNFMLVNVTDGKRETADMATAWYQEQGVSYPIYLDTDLEASIAGGITLLPTLYLLDAEGNAVFGAATPITEESGAKLIEDYLLS